MITLECVAMCAESTAADGSRAQQIGHAASAPEDDGPATAEEGSAPVEAMAQLVPKRPLRSLCGGGHGEATFCAAVLYYLCTTGL